MPFAMRTAAPYLPLEDGLRPAAKWRRCIPWAAALLLAAAAACAVCAGRAAPTAAAAPAAAARAAPASLADDPVQGAIDAATQRLPGLAPTLTKAFLFCWTTGRWVSMKLGGTQFLTHQDWGRWVSYYDIFTDKISYMDARRRLGGGREHKCLVVCGPKVPYEPLCGQLERLAVYHLLVPFVFFYTLTAYWQEMGVFGWIAAVAACIKVLMYAVMLLLAWLCEVQYLFFDPLMDGAHPDVPSFVLLTFALTPDVWLAVTAADVLGRRRSSRAGLAEALALAQGGADLVAFWAALPVVFAQPELGVAILSVSLGWIPLLAESVGWVPSWHGMREPGPPS